MIRFRYIATDADGARHVGQIEATDADAAVAALGERGMVLIESVQAIETAAAADRAHGAAASVMGEGEARSVSRHISELVEAGLPLESGLAAVALELPAGRLRSILQGVVRQLEAGQDLESALEAHRAPAYLKALVRAGARSGQTGQVLEHYVTNAQNVSDVRQTIAMALAYPLIMLIVFTLIVGALLFWIVPQFAEVIIGFAIPLPWITTALIATSQFCRDNGLWIVAAAFAIPLALWLIFRLALGPAHFRRLVCRIPLVGPALRWAGLSRFSQLLALLIENRVPLDEALVLAGDASGDAEIRDDCRQITAEISAGESLVEVARRRRFPASFARALTWDRRHQGLPEIMQSLGDVYASRVRAVVSLLMAILPPLLIIVMGAVVFIVMVALFAPLIRLLNMLS